ncbi:CCAAT box binding factor subunit C [Encephalitozoon intestinalis ATCC 50506]|uniref:CCAAT box binding factor subunit C n=1 Tax=Encephalitozoon intestinalis (strain ATCC 50506) TaxID=876142 RepID=E0S766_ENCIT|nr:CCAAT box binding factor subunit C [Encephalitozoon intestinalis ATCC 50506]ADM11494.1 CCAAT box binding factor subunit C [Encephalitozoon intestinalis ATCC 50506]UTX45206.1 histone-like transcription factor [Encephalitozoon intestinalis]
MIGRMRNEYDLLDERISRFWHQAFKGAVEERILLKDLNLPLARIKRLMKIEEGVRMVASEVPVLFSMITEKFIEELTLRAWINTEENKRRILQKSDLTAAVKTSEMFDFLVYIVPRNDLLHPFNHLVPNKVHHGGEDFSARGDAYVKQHVLGERQMMEDMAEKMGNPHQGFYPQEHRVGDEVAKSMANSHADDYRRGFDIPFGRDMSADIAPSSFR